MTVLRRVAEARQASNWTITLLIFVAFYHFVASLIFLFESQQHAFENIFFFAVLHTILTLGLGLLAPLLLFLIFLRRHGVHFMAVTAINVGLVVNFFATSLLVSTLSLSVLWGHGVQASTFVRDADWFRACSLFAFAYLVAAVSAACVSGVPENNLFVGQDLRVQRRRKAASLKTNRLLNSQAAFTVTKVTPRHASMEISSYSRLNRWNWLHAAVWLHGLFLIINAFLLFLQAQEIVAIANLWTFFAVYFFLGLVLSLLHLLALLRYYVVNTELSNASRLVTRFVLIGFVTAWLITSLLTATWLSRSDCCAPPVDLTELAHYNNVLEIASMLLFIVPSLLCVAVAFHLRPERQSRWSALSFND